MTVLVSGLTEWETSMRRMTFTALQRRWQVHGRGRCNIHVSGNFRLQLINPLHVKQVEFSTALLQRSSPSPRLQRPAWIRELSWPPQVSCTWPGRAGWMSATPAGWPTGASAIPSTFVGRSAVGVCWGCALFISTQTRQDTRFLSPATTPSATQVGHLLPRLGSFFICFIFTYISSL